MITFSPDPWPTDRKIIGVFLFFLLFLGPNLLVRGQAKEKTSIGKTSFSLKEAISFAVENNVTTKNAVLDITASKAKVNEIISIGLPQISGSASYANTYNVQKVILENSQSSPFYTPNLPEGDVVAFGLQLPNSMTAQVQWQQLLFDGSYLVGIQASKVYTQLAEKSLTASKITIAENVSKAYYGVLVNRERLGLLDVNILRLDSSLKEVKALNAQGFAEKLDIDRLEVARNNLLTEKSKTTRLIELSEQLLKFQMSYPQSEKIQLTDKLNESGLNSEVIKPESVDYSRRIEYSQLETQKALAELDLKNVNAGYLPRLVGQYSLGSLTAATDFGNLSKTKRWYYFDQLALSLQVPIFDGFGKYHRAQQSKVNIKKAENGFEAIKQGIDLQLASANTSLLNAQETMRNQKRNMDLAAEVVRVAKIKYTQGVGSNLEVTTAEASLKESQINYFNAVYDALIAKVDQQKAVGTLYSE